MKVISEHISYLLRYHDCVIVPGFGAFVRSYTAASLTEDGVLLPPRTDICFNTSISSNDGMLAHSLMRRENISFDEARLMLSDKTDRMRNILNTDGEIQIGNIGVITKDHDDLLSFTPAIISEPTGDVRITRSGLVPSRTQRQHEEEEQPMQKIGHRNFNTRKNYYLAINKKFANIAASVIVGIACAATFVVPSLENRRPGVGNYASVVPVSTSKTVITDFREEKGGADAVIAPTAEVAQPEETPQPEAPATKPAEQKYYLIVGTFSSPRECRKFIDSSKSSRELGIAEGGKISRVYYASSDDRQQLLDIMNSPEFKAEFADAWIWSRP